MSNAGGGSFCQGKGPAASVKAAFASVSFVSTRWSALAASGEAPPPCKRPDHCSAIHTAVRSGRKPVGGRIAVGQRLGYAADCGAFDLCRCSDEKGSHVSDRAPDEGRLSSVEWLTSPKSGYSTLREATPGPAAEDCSPARRLRRAAHGPRRGAHGGGARSASHPPANRARPRGVLFGWSGAASRTIGTAAVTSSPPASRGVCGE